MVIFHSYVSLPEGITKWHVPWSIGGNPQKRLDVGMMTITLAMPPRKK